MNVQLGIDIATSISIIAAAISYIATSANDRKQKLSLFAFETYKEIVNILIAYYLKLKKCDSEFQTELAMGNEEQIKEKLINMNRILILLKSEIEIRKPIVQSLGNKKILDEIIELLNSYIKMKPVDLVAAIPKLEIELRDTAYGFFNDLSNG